MNAEQMEMTFFVPHPFLFLFLQSQRLSILFPNLSVFSIAKRYQETILCLVFQVTGF